MSAAERATPDTAITVRRPQFDFPYLPQWWVGGNRLATHWGNAGHVFIPLGEQFFIDTVKEFPAEGFDPALAADVRAFIGQESVHKRAHEGLWDVLRARGVPVDAYSEVIRKVRILEAHLPATFRLSVTAALEHYTAAFGESFITEDLADSVPEEMARMLAWHGAEELEHRSVAFDVLRSAGGTYAMRLSGFAFATTLLVVVPGIGVGMFAAAARSQEREARSPHSGSPPGPEPTQAGSDLAAMSRRLLRRVGGHVIDYLRPGFHPSQMSVPTETTDGDS